MIARQFVRLLSLGLFLHAGALQAVVTTVPESELVPSATHERATRLITHFIANYHYRKAPLDDELSATVFERYLQTLDPTRSFFTAIDIDDLAHHRLRMDDYLRDADLAPVYDIFKRYRARVRTRVRHALSLLDREFDFTVDETFNLDRSKAPWPADEAAMQDLWRRRVKNDVLGLKLAGKTPEEIREILTKRYEGIERRTLQLNAEDVFQLFVNAYTGAVEPHTAYFSPRTSENFRIRMSLSLEGIGAVLQADDEYTLVRQVVPGGPADKSGKLHANDRIIGVGQGADGEIVDVIGWRLDDVVDLIRGPKGTVVRLQVLPKGIGPEGPSRTVAITRNKIELEEQAAQKSVLEIPQGGTVMRMGVIEVPTFYLDFEARAAGDPNYRSTTRDVRRLLGELEREGVDGVIVDLRGNGGGSLTEATELTGLFIETGPVVQVRGSDGRVQVERDTDPDVAYDGPLAVLVDRYSASASEIFAGAIQDYRRGIIIGEPTFGKGTVQNLIDLGRMDRSADERLGQLKATIAQFFRVDGDSTQHRGVVPDVVLPTARFGDSEGERGLDNALPWARIQPAKFVPVHTDIGAFDLALARHERRIAEDDAFKALVEQARNIAEARNRTELSLLESRRRAERERARSEQRELENRLRAAIGLPPLPAEQDGAEDDGAEPFADALDDEEDALDKPEHDVVLNEAAHILADLVISASPVKSAEHGGYPGVASSTCDETPCRAAAQ